MNCTLLNDARDTYPLPVKGPVLPGDGIKTVVPCVCYVTMFTHPGHRVMVTQHTPARVASSASKMSSSRALE